MSQQTELHAQTVAAVEHRLHAGHLVVFRAACGHTGVELGILDARGRLQSVAVRAAQRRTRVHRVHRTNGVTYEYPVTYWAWGLHTHGVRRLWPDWWVLVPDVEVDDALVIPGGELAGSEPTVTFCVGARRSRYCRYHGAWAALMAGKRAA